MRRDVDIRLVFTVIEQVVNIFGYDAFAVRTHIDKVRERKPGEGKDQMSSAFEMK